MNKVTLMEGVYNSKKEQLDKSRGEITSLMTERDLLDKTEKLLKFLADKAAKKDLAKMDGLISYGLHKVFPDRDIKFLSEIVEYGKKLRIELKTLYKNNEVSSDTMGSVSVIESFLLRLLCIVKLKKAKIILMDETFSAVDSAYIFNVSNLLSELSKKLAINILLVTHNPGFEEAVDNSLRLKLINNNVEIETLR
jgi:ABC-type phosphate/phosphonate transport system ATPase subunit